VNPPLLFQAVKGRIERALLNLQDLAGQLSDPLGDRPPVHRLQGQRFQNQQVESPLD